MCFRSKYKITTKCILILSRIMIFVISIPSINIVNHDRRDADFKTKQIYCRLPVI